MLLLPGKRGGFVRRMRFTGFITVYMFLERFYGVFGLFKIFEILRHHYEIIDFYFSNFLGNFFGKRLVPEEVRNGRF